MRFIRKSPSSTRSPEGPAVLDPAAFETRMFWHQARQETPEAFVVAPAFLWSETSAKVPQARSVSCPASYMVCGVYSVDRQTLDMWTARETGGTNMRIFNRLQDAKVWAESLNQATAERYFSDLSAGILSESRGWKACAVDRFRLKPAPGLQALAS